MSLFSLGRRFAAAAFAAGLLPLVFTVAAATTDGWINPLDGTWRTGSNWSSNRPPDSTFSLVTITNAGSKTVLLDAATADANLTVQKLTVSDSGGTNTLHLSDLGTNRPLQLLNTLTVGRGGLLSLTNAALSIDGTSGGILSMLGGEMFLVDGFLDCSSTTAAKIGAAAGATSVLRLDGGGMEFFQVQLGAANQSQGLLIISNGIFNSSSLFILGQTSGSTGVVEIAGGELRVTNDLTKVGNLGAGWMTVDGGLAHFAFLSMGENQGASGTVSLNGGELLVTPRTTNDFLRVGSLGYGQLNVSGGTHYVRSELHLADDLSATGIVSVVGGALVVTNDITAIGRYGLGRMTVTGGSVQLTNSSIGRHDGAVGILEVRGNGIVSQVDDMSIGRFAGSTGHVLVDGGLLALTNDNVWVGREGTGDLIISNGVFSARTIWVAVSPDGTNTPQGAVEFYGGTSVLASNLVVGTVGVSTGQVVMAGGSLSISSGGGTALLDVRSGGFSMQGGTLMADQVSLTNNAGQFAFSGGLLQAGSLVVSNGAPFVVGDGVTPAVLELLGGTAAFSDGLVISSNATIRGCGTIIGNIVNGGTLATNCSQTAPSILQASVNGTQVAISFSSLSGAMYTLEYQDALDLPWTAIEPPLPGTGAILSLVDTNAAVPARFYRVKMQ